VLLGHFVLCILGCGLVLANSLQSLCEVLLGLALALVLLGERGCCPVELGLELVLLSLPGLLCLGQLGCVMGCLCIG
jgi:hypothetical protein